MLVAHPIVSVILPKTLNKAETTLLCAFLNKDLLSKGIHVFIISMLLAPNSLQLAPIWLLVALPTMIIQNASAMSVKISKIEMIAHALIHLAMYLTT